MPKSPVSINTLTSSGRSTSPLSLKVLCFQKGAIYFNCFLVSSVI
jgi:hypothetical protein